ncbi:MAG: P1 family peptidase [Actinomycetota bacterium]
MLTPEGPSGWPMPGAPPGTIGTDGLRPGSMGAGVDAILLTGGSGYGLAAAVGVQRWLEEHGRGFQTGPARIPIVAGAVLFDLGVGDPGARPDAEAGHAACDAANDGPVAEGSVGAGTGATVAKLPDPRSGMTGGLGSASARHGDVVVGAVAAVNSLGRIVEADGSTLAGNRGDPDANPAMWPIGNTTLVCVATNARLSLSHGLRLAYAAHDGIALAVRPAHTHWDGDVAFALATGEVDADWVRLPELASEAVAQAIRRGVRAATGVPGAPAIADGAST